MAIQRRRRLLQDMGEPSRRDHTVNTLQVDQPHQGVTRITLDRPERLNAMNAALVAELHQALADVAADRACRVVVLTGAGRGFCAGVDLTGYGDAPGSEGLDRVGATFATQTDIAALVPRLRGLPQPVIAAVNGPAAGGGLALALASDIRIASASARFNVAFVRLGLSGCDIGVSWLLPRLIGASRAWELMLTGRIIDAEEADRIGLVLRVVADDELSDAVLETAGLIAANAPWGVRMTKEVMWSQLEVGSLQAGIDLENRTQVLSSMTDDMREAVAAFLQKRPPHYGSSGEPQT
jgi:enoyl-CoA hydratase